MELVALSANSYHRIARLCGMAKASFTMAESKYKYAFRVNSTGRNEAERLKNAAENTKEEYDAMVTIEAIYVMAEKLEAIARIKSESTRKILDKVKNMVVASNREDSANSSNRYLDLY